MLTEDIMVYADKDMIDAVVRNLLNNAIKFSFQGNSIEIISEVTDQKVLLHIKDYGMGISKSQMSDLFVIKDSKSSHGTNNEKGSGLGLVICYEFLKLNDCKLTVNSEEKVGTTFTIEFPKKEN